MTYRDLDTWDAVETAERIRIGEISAEEVVEAAIARAEEAVPLGALVTPTFDRARETVRAGPNGPFAGVPSALKDLLEVKGIRTTWGSAAVGEFISKKTDAWVRRFEATGLISLGKTATPEFGLTTTTEPLARPPCRNPWNPSRIVGGSSGGSAALVAAGVVPIASASDGGGSIRIPAACCGVVGFKPSRFRMDMKGSALLPVNLATDGVITRTVRDTVAFYNALESVVQPKKVEVIGTVGERPKRRLNIAVYTDAPEGFLVHDEVRDAARAAAHTCANLGHHIEEIDCPFPGTVMEDFRQYWTYVAWLQVTFGRFLTHRGFDRSMIEPWADGLVRLHEKGRWAAFKAIRRLRRFGREYARLFETIDVLVSPTVASVAPPLGYLATDLPFPIVWDRLREFASFTPIQNIAGAPSVSLPLYRNNEGLPIGVQFAAAFDQDRVILELAREIETAAPWERTAPRKNWL